MNITLKHRIARNIKISSALTLLTLTALLGAVTFGYCDDDAYTMAPPIELPASATSDPEVASVFNWQEVPVNQDVPIIRAVFDEGGYQLYDTAGETIVVRFKNNNLYVMKFAVSDDGSTYFVNSGTSPILYLPQNGYLENATVDGARWYPFGQSFHPSSPVFLGIAPSWNDYVTLGWYPDMYCYGGYWSGVSVGFFTPTIGLFIAFDGNRFNSWGDYGNYIGHNPPPYHLGYSNHNIYHYASRTYWGSRSFKGTPSQGFSGRSSGFGHPSDGGSFRGAIGTSTHSFSAPQSPHGSFGGASPSGNSGGFRGSANGGAPHSGGFNGAGGGNSDPRASGGGGSHGGSFGGGGDSRGSSGDSHGGGGGGGDSHGGGQRN